MKQLRALKGHTYANKFQKVGAIYNASDADAKLMVLLKNSEHYTAADPMTANVARVIVPDPVFEKKAKRPYVRRNLQADKPSGYTTKDMKAE